ncbi:MAG: GTPase HflX, partial [Pseudomonadota bacterium]
EGADDLLTTLERHLSAREIHFRLTLPNEDGAGLAWAYANGRVVERRDTETGQVLTLAGDAGLVDSFRRRFPDRTDLI